ncbi:hypothetical protein P8452_19523 [Trifolium repens]|nr:hypothetical protein QL285_011835 [Trifolium repens]WJX31045.1 hypothetical protein P8452_19523 [Trifolium repens]
MKTKYFILSCFSALFLISVVAIDPSKDAKQNWYTYGPDGIWRDNQHWGAGWRGGGGKGGIIEKNRGSSKVGGGRYLQPIPNNGKKTGGGYVLPIPGTGKEGDT